MVTAEDYNMAELPMPDNGATADITETMPEETACDINAEIDMQYSEFSRKYHQNKENGNHIANLKLVDEMLPAFYGTRHEKSLYDVRTEAIYLQREIEKSPLVNTGCSFEIRENAGYAIVKLTSLDFRRVTALRVGFDVLDTNGIPTGAGKDYYYATETDINPGETDTFIWQVDNMSNPESIGNFRVLELAFSDRTKWYHWFA